MTCEKQSGASENSRNQGHACALAARSAAVPAPLGLEQGRRGGRQRLVLDVLGAAFTIHESRLTNHFLSFVCFVSFVVRCLYLSVLSRIGVWRRLPGQLLPSPPCLRSVVYLPLTRPMGPTGYLFFSRSSSASFRADASALLRRSISFWRSASSWDCSWRLSGRLTFTEAATAATYFSAVTGFSK